MTELVIRRCERSDLRSLEWSPHLRRDRPLIEHVYEQTGRGTAAMLVATLGRDFVGQVWVDFARKPGVAILWCLRVRHGFQGRGIGTQLVLAGEREARRAAARETELAVEPDNPRARALYVRLGYQRVGSEPAVDPLTGAALGFELEVLRWPLARRDGIVARPW